MFYELATLSGPLLKLREMDAAAQDWMADAAAGTVLGRWRTDIGQLGQVLLLRQFDSLKYLSEERRRALLDRDPFRVRGLATSVAQESYEGFPFLAPAAPRQAGGIYEFRTYFLTVGGIPATLDWLGSGHRAGQGLYRPPRHQHVRIGWPRSDPPHLGV
ncbi:hypothetical protein [Bradyrhizobium pachyrhizi]|uniref:hypothetical protein n=1 Tax=Bradyrhizobium pachyrhizi TaxID=280333 RepID=UPI003D362EA2